MHELSTINYVIKQVDKICDEQDLTKVGSITLEVGEVSGIIAEYLVDYFNWAKKKNSRMEDCELKIEDLKAVTYCQDCKQTYSTVEFGKECPHCNSKNTFLVTGNEYNIKQIEAY